MTWMPDYTVNGEFCTQCVDRPQTRCKHGVESCPTCGTCKNTDIIHRARTPNKRDAARARRKAKRKAKKK